MTNRVPLAWFIMFLITVLWGRLVIAGEAFFENGFEPDDLPDIPFTEQPPSSRHTPRTIGSTASGQGFYEYLPPGYGDGQAYPLLVFIHGLGENGDGDSELGEVLRHGPPLLINQDNWPNSRPFVVLSPQRTGDGCTRGNQIRDFIDFAVATYDINVARIYLTGLSCGAIGSWGYLGNNLDMQIAAMVPIAGNGRPAFNNAGCDLGRTPIWAFHGDNDGTVNVAGTTVPIESLQDCEPAPVDAQMVIYPDVGHNSWTRTYNLSAGHDIYAWMLGYRNSDTVFE